MPALRRRWHQLFGHGSPPPAMPATYYCACGIRMLCRAKLTLFGQQVLARILQEEREAKP